MFKNIGIGFILSVLIFACNPKSEEEKQLEKSEKVMQAHFTANNITAQKGIEGVYYVISKKTGSGKKPTIGDLTDFNITIELLNKTVIDTVYKKQIGYSLYGKGTLIDLFSQYLEKGDEGTFYVPYNLINNGTIDRGPVTAYSPLVFKIKLQNIRNESEQITSYITDNKLTMEKTSTGLYYQITTPVANGELVKAGQTVTLKYTGKLLYYTELTDDKGKAKTTFDAGTFSFKLGAGEVVKGFDEGVSKLKVGEKATLIFPSDLGYGKNGSGSTIPSYAPLQFEVEVTAARL